MKMSPSKKRSRLKWKLKRKAERQKYKKWINTLCILVHLHKLKPHKVYYAAMFILALETL